MGSFDEGEATDSQDSDLAIVSAHESRVLIGNRRSNQWNWKAANRLTDALWNYKNNQQYNMKDLKLCLRSACEVTIQTK